MNVSLLLLDLFFIFRHLWSYLLICEYKKYKVRSLTVCVCDKIYLGECFSKSIFLFASFNQRTSYLMRVFNVCVYVYTYIYI